MLLPAGFEDDGAGLRRGGRGARGSERGHDGEDDENPFDTHGAFLAVTGQTAARLQRGPIRSKPSRHTWRVVGTRAMACAR
jgi:hypothetical protein